MNPPREEMPETRLLHVGLDGGAPIRTVGPPIQNGSTVLLPDASALYDDGRITYGRAGLGTHHALIEGLCALENAASASLFPSGLAALTGALLAVLAAGDEVLVTDAVYKPTRRFCERMLSRFGVSVRFFPARATAAELEALLGPSTKLILLESPGSLTFEMQDVRSIAEMARSRGVLTMIDNTWAAGYYYKPLDHGVDLSVQALTKYVGGHSDVFMGSVAVSSPAMTDALAETVTDVGWAVPAQDAGLMLRGLRTLPTRLARHGASALRVASWLSRHPRVLDVLHPALPESPDHHLWRRDFTGAPGLFAFVLRSQRPTDAEVFLNQLRLFGLGFSWGGFESLALHCDPQLGVRRQPVNLGGQLVRLNIGLEDPDDLIADLDRALRAMA